MHKLKILFFFHFLVFNYYSQKSIEAFKTTERITIDGLIDEKTWALAQVAKDFTQLKPSPGNPPSQNTEVIFLYDDNALYIAARCFDKAENVSKILSQRDDFNANVDNFQIILDTYNDDQNGFIFGVSSMGVQFDAKVYVSDISDELNMAWNSAVVRNENGWQLEMRIPYSAFRFPKADVQNWGVNFYRYISLNREESTWNPIKPDFDNLPGQSGDVTNLTGIEPPLRLAFMPYISSYLDHSVNDTGKSNWSRSLNGGMDIKFGLNEAFTLDMTLVPDFGQVVFDNKVLNLSPFEIQFNENRQFFTEGTELFNKSGLFYSRRIGIQSPNSVLTTNLNLNETLSDIPNSAQIYNATKLSGRTKSGLGIGVFNGITAEQRATANDSTTNESRSLIVSPLSNFNVLVLDQNLKNNSYITLTNTNVMREGNFYDANVTGLNTKINSKKNTYFISGKTTVSNKFYSSETKTGHNWGLKTGKQKGKYVFSTGYQEESDTYDPNDLGFNYNNNKRILDGTISYRIFQPFWKLNQFSTSLTFEYNRLYKPNVFTYANLNGSVFANSKKFHAFGAQFYSSVTEGYDYFEPRKSGMFFTRPKWLNFGAWISSNYQKRFALDARFNYVFVDRDNWNEYYYSISPRLRVSDKLFVIYSLSQSISNNSQGYAVAFGTPVNSADEVVFGSRDLNVVTNTIDLQLTLTNKMGITFRLRHYRSTLSYDSFYYLNDNGSLTPNQLDGLDINGESVYNTNYNAFTIDLVYRWVFLPASELNIVWKNAIFSNDKKINESYFNNVSSMLNYSPLNSFSFKVIYWLDYQSFKRKNKL